MARKTVFADIDPADAEDDVKFLEAVLFVNDERIGSSSIGPEGGELELGTAEFPENQDTTVRVTLVAVDKTDRQSEVPAVVTEVFKGLDTIPPKTPKAPRLRVEDAAPATPTPTAPAGATETVVP